MGIPNPYSFGEHLEADRRWRTLYKNAGPPLEDLNNSNIYESDSNEVIERISAPKVVVEDVDLAL